MIVIVIVEIQSRRIQSAREQEDIVIPYRNNNYEVSNEEYSNAVRRCKKHKHQRRRQYYDLVLSEIIKFNQVNKFTTAISPTTENHTKMTLKQKKTLTVFPLDNKSIFGVDACPSQHIKFESKCVREYN